MKKSIKILLIGIFFLVVSAIFSSVDAASASISASSKSISTSESTTVTVTIKAAAWNLKVSGATSQSYVGNTDDGENATKTETFKFSSSTEGTYTISLSGDVSDGSTNATTDVSDSVTITVSKSSSPSSNSNTNSTKTASSTNTSTSNNTTDTTTEEPTFTSVEETVYSTGEINVRKSYSTDSDVLGQLQTGESITRIGVGSNGWSMVSYNGETGYIKTSLLTTEEPSLSSDATLQTLEITPEGLSPEFSSDVTSYTLIVGADVDKLDIITSPTDENATVEISGNESFQMGENEVNITVTAEDGTTNTYTINVIKQETSQLGLASLKIDGYTLSPTFSVNTYEYKINVLDPNVTELNITANANDANATVEISGNTNLQKGDNTVTITVTSEDGKETVIYRINVNKTSEATATTSNISKYIIIGIIIFVILLIIIILIVKNRKKKAYNYNDENDDQDDYSDLYGYASRNKNAIDDESLNSSLENNEKQENIKSEDQELSNKFDGNNVDDIYSDTAVKSNFDNHSINNDVSENNNFGANNYSDTSEKDNFNTSNYNDTLTKDNFYTSNYNDTLVKDNFYTGNYNDTVVKDNFNAGNYNDTVVKDNFNTGNYNDTVVKDNFNASNYNNTFIKDNIDANNYNDTSVKDNYNNTSWSEINNSTSEVDSNASDDFNSKYNDIMNNTEKKHEPLNPYVTKDIYGDYNDNIEKQNTASNNNQYDDYTIDDNYKFRRSKGKH